jgi:hypothetical protein
MCAPQTFPKANVQMKRLMWALLVVVSGCGPGAELAVEPGASDIAADEGAITSVNHSKVERQSIGNCWAYATTGWAEALNKTATGTQLNLSQSYISYWHWFDQIANSRTSEISTGGSYETALRLFERYGLVREGDFIPSEATAEMSARQKSALDRVNASLKSGKLATTTARSDRALVRAELDAAFGLDTETIAALDAVFGKDVSRTVSRTYATQATPVTKRANGQTITILRAKDVPATVRRAGGSNTTATLADAMGTYRSGFRSGTFAFREVDYPVSAGERRALQKRIQRALHDKQPVIVSWLVDFNALGRDSTFRLDRLQSAGPGRQGGHMVVMHDYEVDNVPGFGTLKAGVDETRPEALAAALSDQATVKFFRVKNSWGTDRPDRWDMAALPGYHDLYVDYLNGPVKKCAEKADGSTDTTNCYDAAPWWDVVLPAGY